MAQLPVLGADPKGGRVLYELTPPVLEGSSSEAGWAGLALAAGVPRWKKSRIVRLGFGTARQKRVLE